MTSEKFGMSTESFAAASKHNLAEVFGGDVTFENFFRTFQTPTVANLYEYMHMDMNIYSNIYVYIYTYVYI